MPLKWLYVEFNLSFRVFAHVQPLDTILMQRNSDVSWLDGAQQLEQQERPNHEAEDWVLGLCLY